MPMLPFTQAIVIHPAPAHSQLDWLKGLEDVWSGLFIPE